MKNNEAQNCYPEHAAAFAMHGQRGQQEDAETGGRRNRRNQPHR
jgi:hypothetical protein